MATTTYPHIPPSAPSLPLHQALAVSRIYATPTTPAHRIWRWSILYILQMTLYPQIPIVSTITMALLDALTPRLLPCM